MFGKTEWYHALYSNYLMYYIMKAMNYPHVFWEELIAEDFQTAGNNMLSCGNHYGQSEFCFSLISVEAWHVLVLKKIFLKSSTVNRVINYALLQRGQRVSMQNWNQKKINMMIRCKFVNNLYTLNSSKAGLI